MARYSNEKEEIPLGSRAMAPRKPSAAYHSHSHRHPLLPHIPHPKLPFSHSHHASTSSDSAPARPNLPNRQNSIQTRYMNMLLAMDEISRLHNILASFFTWILLAGFVIFPGTFTSIQSLDTNPDISNSETAAHILKSVKHIPLLVVASLSSGIGAAGMCWLWWKHLDNFVWLLNRIFLPGCLHSFAGLISTLINVYSQQGGAWSITARATAIVTGSCMVVTGALFGVYNFWVLKRVKKSHARDMQGIYGGHKGEGIVEKVNRKVKEPALEPGSVV